MLRVELTESLLHSIYDTGFISERMKFLKPGKVVIVTSGRYAGKKAVIVQNTDKKTKERGYGHSLIAGIKKYPKRVVRGMSKRRIARRSQVGAFLRVVNHKHFLPTRYNAGANRWFFQKLRF